MQQLINIKKFDDDYGFDIGNLNLFSTEESLNKTNEQAVGLLMSLVEMMDIERKRERITLLFLILSNWNSRSGRTTTTPIGWRNSRMWVRTERTSW